MIKTLWELLNGKKTNIGAAVAVITWLLTKFGFGDVAPDIENIIMILNESGMWTAVIGLVHKIIKLVLEAQKQE